MTAPAFPFVGARAQVTVAESEAGHSSHWLRRGDEVYVSRQECNGDWKCRRADGRVGWIAAPHLSPVPADQPGPDQPTEHDLCDGCDGVGDHGGPYRCPDCNGSGNQPTEHEDRWTTISERVHEDDYDVVESVARALTSRRERVSALERQNAADSAAYEEWGATLRAERDAARAELAAAHNTDGHGLPQVEVADVYERTVSFSDGKVLRLPDGDDAGPYINQQAAYWLALARLDRRLRLADEATTEATTDA